MTAKGKIIGALAILIIGGLLVWGSQETAKGTAKILLVPNSITHGWQEWEAFLFFRRGWWLLLVVDLLFFFCFLFSGTKKNAGVKNEKT